MALIQIVENKKKSLGIYVHIPFCRSKCEYCDFYSIPGARSRDLMDRYLDAVILHIREAAQGAAGYEVDTVYFGGGTPSFFGAGGLAKIFAEIDRRFDVSRDAEVSLEANPDSVTLPMLTRLRRAGFNRISLGVQSSDDETLRRLGRVHTWQQVKDAVAACRKAGLDNISLDLIYGLPDQTLEQWENTLADALVLAPRHISCYGLKLEEGTPLYDRRESLSLPDGDLQADMYLYAVELLTQNGYQQYEISNFAQPGYESRHNLKYWMLEEYAGFGPGAYSDFGGVRYGYTRDLDGYIAGRLDLAESERISPQEREMEYIMLRLRTARGIDIREFENRFRQRFTPLAAILESCAAHGLARQTETGWCLTPRGFLVSNRIIGDLQEELNREKVQRLARAAQGDYRVVE